MALSRLRAWAQVLRRDTTALWFACRDPATPLLPKLLAAIVVAYALSPIDLIPDFIPILGFLDELILLPAALYLVTKLISPEVMTRARARATSWLSEGHARPVSRVAAAVIVALWALLIYAGWRALAR